MGPLETCSSPARMAFVPVVHSDAFEVKLFILFGVSWNEPTAFVQRSDTIRWQHLLRFGI